MFYTFGTSARAREGNDFWRVFGVGLRNDIAERSKRAVVITMHLSAEHLEIAARLDAKVQRLLGLGYDDLAILSRWLTTCPILSSC